MYGTVWYNSTVHTKYSTTFPSDGVSTWRQGGGRALGPRPIYRAIRGQARNIVPPRLQQVNPVQTRGFSLVGLTR